MSARFVRSLEHLSIAGCILAAIALVVIAFPNLP